MATRSKMKSQYRKENADRRPHATAKHIRISSRKVKIVIDLIRGKSVEDAEAILMYTPKAASEPTRQAEISYAVFCLKKKTPSRISPSATNNTSNRAGKPLRREACI